MEYPTRFENFAKFHHSLLQQQYPLSPEDQCIPTLFDATRIQFLAMNSSWAIDEFFPARSGINDSALARGLVKADEQIRIAKEAGRIQENEQVLRIAVWHHPATGNEKIINDAFIDRLRQAKVRLCLHGHVHEERADVIKYIHPRRVHVIGAGSFGAPAKDRPESVPRLYNVLEVERDLTRVKVHTRSLRKEGGAWEGWAVWPGSSPNQRLTYYEIDL
jgi:predicted phosphodiesterase